MPASENGAPQRFNLTLDPGLVLERMILGRLSKLQRKRGQDWLRALLVQGFLVEGQWLRSERGIAVSGGESRASRIPATQFGSWLERTDGSPKRLAARSPVRRPAVAAEIGQGRDPKPFAHLGKVIG